MKMAKAGGCVLLLCGMMISAIGLWIYFCPVQYRASARVNISSEIATLIPPEPGKFYFDSDCYEASLIPGEARVFKSNAVLQTTVENLNLCSEWKMTTNKAVKKLKRCVFSQVTTPDLRIKITATDTDSERVLRIVKELVDAYCQHRKEGWQRTQQSLIQQTKESLPRLEQDIKAAQDKFDQIKQESNLKDPVPLWIDFKTNNPAYFEAGEKLWEAKLRYKIAEWKISPKLAAIEGEPKVSELSFPKGYGIFLGKMGVAVFLSGFLAISCTLRK